MLILVILEVFMLNYKCLLIDIHGRCGRCGVVLVLFWMKRGCGDLFHLYLISIHIITSRKSLSDALLLTWHL
jgi:hypothetical protein